MSALPEETRLLAAALGRLPSGLFVLTASQAQRETGILVSWVQQCSFSPPRLSVAINNQREIADWLTPGRPFTLNLLAEGQNSLVGHFARGFAPDESAFTGIAVQHLPGCAPILADALGYLLCEVVSRFPAGDHDLFIATVLAGQLLQPNASPYVHLRKNGLRY